MMRTFGRLMIAVAFAVTGFVAVTPAMAQPVQMLAEKDWVAYRLDEDGTRTCFISSVPTKSAGDYDPENRGETRVYVSHGPVKEERNVVQFLAGYKHKKQTDVKVTIDKRTFTLFTLDGRAYAESEADDVAMITAMKRGSKMTVVGTSSRGTKTTDTYSLAGFTKTKNLIDKTCK
ncbi:invasion associated locus B family protein [Alphaproteobacteria bacterium]|jgi:hypothetical protein|nr:invasion associated locus B family protein [Alphaproteobacteria bacterium]